MQRFVCVHHKTGTKLLGGVFSDLCSRLGLSYASVGGVITDVPEDIDVVFRYHSGLDLTSLRRLFKAAHVVRDPRDVVVSGYLYHIKCAEAWCVNRDFSCEAPIMFPRVPLSQQHRSESWKQAYLESLAGRSYQDNLKLRSPEDGLSFELENYGSWTVDAMQDWDYDQADVLECKLEQIAAQYDEQMARLMMHLDLPFHADILEKQDVARMSRAEISANTHISVRWLIKWRDYLSDRHLAEIDVRYGASMRKLGYAS